MIEIKYKCNNCNYKGTAFFNSYVALNMQNNDDDSDIIVFHCDKCGISLFFNLNLSFERYWNE